MSQVLDKFVNKKGGYIVNESKILLEQDFLKIYDLIESVGRFELC